MGLQCGCFCGFIDEVASFFFPPLIELVLSLKNSKVNNLALVCQAGFIFWLCAVYGPLRLLGGPVAAIVGLLLACRKFGVEGIWL